MRKKKINIPPQVQIAIGIAVLGGVGYGIYAIIKGIKNAEAKRKAAEQLALLQGEIQQLATVPGQGPSYPLSQYDTWANNLYMAMDSSWYNPFSWGTTEDLIIQTFQKLNNNADYLKLTTAFGTKDGYTLTEWLVDELSQSYIDQLNSILSQKGIIYKI